MEPERFLKDCTVLSRTVSSSRTPEVENVCNSEVKNRIFKKITRKLAAMETGNGEREPVSCSELTPDVIVIKDDQSLLFEAQNVRALEVLAQICGFDTDTMTLSERIRVHPCRSPHIITKLKAAGTTVAF